ncbi:MAG: hypothetical protein AB7P02_05240 [Alphaproteobacteria bacterium]
MSNMNDRLSANPPAWMVASDLWRATWRAAVLLAALVAVCWAGGVAR